jgi:VanZ family protein
MQLKELLKNQWPGISWGFLILILTGAPGNYFPQISSFWDWLAPDKLVHVLIFGVLTYLLLRGNRRYYGVKDRYYKTIACVTILGVAYGGLTEWLQNHVFIGRDGNLYDFLANTIGCAAGVLIFHDLHKKRLESERIIR